MKKNNLLITTLLIAIILTNGLSFTPEFNTNTQDTETGPHQEYTITTTDLPKGIYIVLVDTTKKPKTR